jgi:hypothetical protein
MCNNQIDGRPLASQVRAFLPGWSIIDIRSFDVTPSDPRSAYNNWKVKRRHLFQGPALDLRGQVFHPWEFPFNYRQSFHIRMQFDAFRDDKVSLLRYDLLAKWTSSVSQRQNRNGGCRVGDWLNW